MYMYLFGWIVYPSISLNVTTCSAKIIYHLGYQLSQWISAVSTWINCHMDINSQYGSTVTVDINCHSVDINCHNMDQLSHGYQQPIWINCHCGYQLSQCGYQLSQYGSTVTRISTDNMEQLWRVDFNDQLSRWISTVTVGYNCDRGDITVT